MTDAGSHTLAARFTALASGSFANNVDPDALQKALSAALASARQTWPTLAITDDVFLKHLARVDLTTDPVGALSRLHHADLFVACACARGAVAAVAAIDQQIKAIVPKAVAHLGDRSFAADVQQVVSERLLLPRADGTVKIVEYLGSGPLGGWIRVVALRVALNLRRGAAEKTADRQQDIDLLEATALDPETQVLRSRCKDQFGATFRDALNSLSARERTVLRMHFTDVLSIDEIGAVFRVHRVTAARWINQAQAALIQQLQRLLSERLGLSASELQSLGRFVRSEVTDSLHNWLREAP